MFKVNDIVRLKGKKRTAKITILLQDIEGGVKLDKRLGGYGYWNIVDLELVKGGKNE